ncbi:hypothetical protein YYE_02181 [Plasmodium vinckei vinckei]|nr:hypothetical protein YYE_02181 [Plasmodium vinckei vinckei]
MYIHVYIDYFKRWNKNVNKFIKTRPNEAKCTGGYPLIIKLNEDVEGNVNIIEQEMNPEFIKNVLSKVDYEVLYNTAKQFGVSLLSSYNSNHLEDEGFLNSVHHALFKVHFLSNPINRDI